MTSKLLKKSALYFPPQESTNFMLDGLESHEVIRANTTTVQSPGSTSILSKTTASSTATSQHTNTHTMGNGRYPKHTTDQRNRDFNYYKQTSLTFHSEHGPGIICLACETSKYLLAQYASKPPKVRVSMIQPLDTGDTASEEESIKHFPTNPVPPSTSPTWSLNSDIPEFMDDII